MELESILQKFLIYQKDTAPHLQGFKNRSTYFKSALSTDADHRRRHCTDCKGRKVMQQKRKRTANGSILDNEL
eukprot:4829189-Amphidinium_carterae.3